MVVRLVMRRARHALNVLGLNGPMVGVEGNRRFGPRRRETARKLHGQHDRKQYAEESPLSSYQTHRFPERSNNTLDLRPRIDFVNTIPGIVI